MPAKQNVAILINCHRVAISPMASRHLVEWLARIIQSADPGLIVQADLAAAVIDVASADGDDSVLNVVGDGQ